MFDKVLISIGRGVEFIEDVIFTALDNFKKKVMGK